jgi:Icc-related predicted phosphoesterase
MKILCISDTHNKHKQIPNEYLENADGSIDMIIHAGDMTGRGFKNEIMPFLDWYNELNFKHKILIAGNHDFYFEMKGEEKRIAEMLALRPNITYLNDSGIEIDGIKIWGSPVQPWFYNWAFNRVEEEIGKHWDLIPLDTDILITHGPVKGYLDLTMNGDVTGCPQLLKKISELKNLKMHVAGHIHEAYGHVKFPDGGLFINASVLNHRYEMQNKPILVELDEETKHFNVKPLNINR